MGMVIPEPASHLEHTTTDEDRDVYLNQTTRAILDDLVAKALGDRSEYVFNNPETKTGYNDVRKRCASLLRVAGIEDFRFHDLRHSKRTIGMVDCPNRA